MVKIGDRVELIHTSDPYTHLKRGDTGTITGIDTILGGQKQIWVNWDDGSKLALLEGIDRYKVITE